MKNLFDINDLVMSKTNEEVLTVKDFEYIDGQFLYYFDNFVAYPESQLECYDEEKYRQKLLDMLLKINITKCLKPL